MTPVSYATQDAHSAPLRLPSACLAADTRRRNRVRQLSLILGASAREAGAIAMNPTAFVQAMLPHREVYLRDADGRPVEVADGRGGTERLLATHYSATNGDYRLSIRAGLRTGPSHLHPLVSRGIPHGGLARLLLAFIVTEARTRNSRTIPLGGTLTAFCERIDVTPSGGANGRLRYLLDQVLRLATCAVTWEWTVYSPGREDLHGDNLFVVENYHVWHRAGSPSSEPVSGGSITLSPGFWDHVAGDCFPLDFRKAQLFRARPTAYDLYLWLTYRLAGLQRSGRPHVAVNYDQLHEQLGSHYGADSQGALTSRGKKDFAYEVRRALGAISAAWPALRYETPRGRLVVFNTGPDVEVRPPRVAT